MYVYIEVLLSTQVSLFMYISFFSFQGKAPQFFQPKRCVELPDGGSGNTWVKCSAKKVVVRNSNFHN